MTLPAPAAAPSLRTIVVLRGAIIAANADPNADPVIINLQPATTYNLTLTNATQENNAATGNLDITTTLHSVTIAGGGSTGVNASIIDASALNTGNVRDRVFRTNAERSPLTHHRPEKAAVPSLVTIRPDLSSRWVKQQ